MLLNLRAQYSAGTTPRQTADAVITALTPAAWYRNATGVTEAGGFASQWDDYSGNARHLVQAAGTNQPAYSAGVFTFDGVDNYMTASFTSNQPITYYLVGSQVTWSAGFEYLFDGGIADRVALAQAVGTPGLSLYAGSFVANNTNLAVNTAGIVCAVFNGASSSLRVNNTVKTTGNAGANNAAGVTLGGRAGGAGQAGHMTAREFIIFSAAHDDATQSSVITALNNALTVF